MLICSDLSYYPSADSLFGRLLHLYLIKSDIVGIPSSGIQMAFSSVSSI